MAPFTNDMDVQVYMVGDAARSSAILQAILLKITAITGIEDAMVEGKSIDRLAVAAFAALAALVIAHNAAFDRKYLERSRFARRRPRLLLRGASGGPRLLGRH